jgi:hypothetical protein
MPHSAILLAAGAPWPPILSGLVVVLMAAGVWYLLVYRRPAPGPQAFTRLGPFYIAARPYTIDSDGEARTVTVDWQLRNELTQPQSLDPTGIALVLDQTSYLPPQTGAAPLQLRPRETRSVPAAYTLPGPVAEALVAGRVESRVALRPAPDGPLSMALPIALAARGD